jgi:hypothetical protein
MMGKRVYLARVVFNDGFVRDFSRAVINQAAHFLPWLA